MYRYGYSYMAGDQPAPTAVMLLCILGQIGVIHYSFYPHIYTKYGTAFPIFRELFAIHVGYKLPR